MERFPNRVCRGSVVASEEANPRLSSLPCPAKGARRVCMGAKKTPCELHPEVVVSTPQALATVTAIIDGTGSIGAVVGPAATGLIAQFAPTYNDMFYMLYVSAAAATVLLSRLTGRELRSKWFTRSHERCRAAAAAHVPPGDPIADPSDRSSLHTPLLVAE